MGCMRSEHPYIWVSMVLLRSEVAGAQGWMWGRVRKAATGPLPLGAFSLVKFRCPGEESRREQREALV